MFLTEPTAEIYRYSDMYLTVVAPCYFLLGFLAVYRTSVQSMQNGWAPFAACMIELVMRIADYRTVWCFGIYGGMYCKSACLAWSVCTLDTMLL